MRAKSLALYLLFLFFSSKVHQLNKSLVISCNSVIPHCDVSSLPTRDFEDEYKTAHFLGMLYIPKRWWPSVLNFSKKCKSESISTSPVKDTVVQTSNWRGGVFKRHFPPAMTSVFSPLPPLFSLYTKLPLNTKMPPLLSWFRANFLSCLKAMLKCLACFFRS